MYHYDQAAIITLNSQERKEREMLSQQHQEQEGEEKVLTYYSSHHQILLVGDGDFSFSLCLANSFGSASNILASSLDSYDKVTKKYKNAKSNLEKLEHLGATILHGVNATKMKLHTDLMMRKFDRIIFNFPHAGFHGMKEDNMHLIRKHQNLISGFFRNANGMLRAHGEIHVNHKTTAPFCRWDLSGLASKNSLILFECVDFNISHYPGYNQKRGDGSRCDEPFPLGEASTFKFIISAHTKKIPNSLNHNRLPQRPPRVLNPMPQLSPTFDARYSFNAMNGSSHWAGLPQTSENECFHIFGGYFSHARQTFGKPEYNIELSVRKELEHAYAKYRVERPGSSLSGYINLLEQLQHLSRLRSTWLRDNLVSLDQQLMQAPYRF